MPKAKPKAKLSQPQVAEEGAGFTLTKVTQLVVLMRRPEGATLAQMQGVIGWQAHSIRGAMSGSIKKKLGLTIVSEKIEFGRVYRIVGAAADDGV